MQKQPSHTFVAPVALDRESLLRGILDRRVQYWRLDPALIYGAIAPGAKRPLTPLTSGKYGLILSLQSGFMVVLAGLTKEDAHYRAAELRTRRAATGFHLWN